MRFAQIDLMSFLPDDSPNYGAISARGPAMNTKNRISQFQNESLIANAGMGAAANSKIAEYGAQGTIATANANASNQVWGAVSGALSGIASGAVKKYGKSNNNTGNTPDE